MYTKQIWRMLAAAGLAGCASTGAGMERGETDFSGVARRGVPSMRVGQARLINARVDPMQALRVSSEGDALAIRFAERGRSHLVARLDAASLETLSVAPQDSTEYTPPATAAARVVLDDGRFVVCWTRGSIEWGHRALAQEFNQDGSPRGAPVVISSPDVDVMGAPGAAAAGGGRVVATFAASSSSGVQLVAVPLEDAAAPARSDLTARR
jgi:hypothetical protein